MGEAVRPPLLATLALAAAAARAEPEPPSPALPEADPLAEIAARLERSEERLAGLESKLDRLEELLRTIYGNRIRRAEALAADAALASAVAAVEARYDLAGIGEALTADGTAGLAECVKRLARVASARGPAEFAADRDVQRLLAAVAGRADFTSEHAHGLLWSVSCGDAAALGTLVDALLSSDSPLSREVALWGAIRLPRSKDWMARLGALARSNREGDSRLRALALAAAAAQLDPLASKELAGLVRSRALAGAFVFRLAGELRAAGASAAFRVYLELLGDEQYAFAAAQAFSRIEGFDRRLSWREAREEREKVYEEFRAWLDRNEPALRFDAARGRFVAGGAAEGRAR